MSIPDPLFTEDKLVVDDNWPMNLEATREELRKAQKRLERYRAALRLANVEIERRNRGIIALTAFAYQASRAATPAALLKLGLVQALEATAASAGAIVLINAETKALTLGIHKGLTPQLIQILTGQELDQGATALMPHLVAGSGALLEYDTSDDQMERLLLSSSSLASLVSLPLQIGPRLMGALLTGRQDKQPFTPAELCFLMAISQETAIALESLRLREGVWQTVEALLGGETTDLNLQKVGTTDLELEVATPFDLPVTSSTASQPDEDDLEHLLAAMMEAEDEVQQQNTDLQTLNAIAEMMNRTLDLQEILQRTVDQTKTTLGTDAAWLYMVDERSHLEMRAHIGLSRTYVRAMQRLKRKDGVEGRVVTDNKAYFIESITTDGQSHKIWVDKEGLQGLAAVPIPRPELEAEPGEASSHVVGVLATGTIAEEAHPWSPREMRLLTSIANQVALAIENARLYERLQQDRAGLAAGNEVLQEINNMLSADNALLTEFMQGHLEPGMTAANQILKRLMTQSGNRLDEAHRRNLTTLQKIVNHLTEMAKRVAHV